MKKIIAFLLAAALASAAFAQAADTLAEGVVRKINKEAGKVTIKHGPIVNLNMPGMTMVFRVRDTAMLEQVKAGDKIKFLAENINGALTVTQMEPAN